MRTKPNDSFLEHGAGGHGTTIFGEVTQIPLLVKPPAGIELLEENGAVDLLDVTATIAAIGTGRTFGLGRDLRARPLGRRPVKIENFPQIRAALHSAAVIDASRKLISENDRLELYDLASDPLEQHDLAREQQALVQQLSSFLPPLRLHQDAASDPQLFLSREETDQLRALGYITR